MNPKNLLAALILLISAFSLSSCKKFLEGINDNPNNPSSVRPDVLLPAAQGTLAYTLGGDIQRYSGIMTQYFTGVSRQFDGYQRYIFSEEDFNNLWNSMYAGVMVNLNEILKIDEEKGGSYSAYAGISKILMAYSLMVTTDLFGDVPFEEAFQGAENLTPAYETQEHLYSHIPEMLDEAIQMLTSETGEDIALPGSDDFIYEGDLNSWIGLAYALKARAYIHQVNRNANAAALAMDALNAGGSIADAGFPFSSAAPGPWYQYIEQRDDIAYTGSCLSLMQSRNDPRYAVYNDVNGTLWGVGYLGPFFAAEASSVWLMTEFERHFIKAEAMLRLGHASTEVQAALVDAVNASFSFYGIDPASPEATAYVSAHCQLTGSFNSDLEIIMTEKWIANYLSMESWTDLRRTGYPQLTPNSGAAAIPTRFIYPTNERLYNPQPGINDNSDLFTPKLWWLP
ncbi:MAG: SusD/RagB family nutrient-binding outer membrane lipoprotein [Chitinophagales bacterium]|nr:SusD/RagB family nutrient-binding outer membrane lipoprotein [Chitinophagales bacterium]MDW8393985.1 SusD/RagB family nutrient-binding outer membrane lipoprotein [Chitinophagales bacterium]